MTRQEALELFSKELTVINSKLDNKEISKREYVEATILTLRKLPEDLAIEISEQIIKMSKTIKINNN